MNDIPRGTPRARLINSLLAPSHEDQPNTFRPDVFVGVIITDSRLDDELSVATIEFSETPDWLQRLNKDPYGFPKTIAFGTIWRRVDTNAIDDDLGQTAFIRAVNKGGMSLLAAERIAEFDHTDVNIQDKRGRTALHWASAGNHSEMVKLCLSVPECHIGLLDEDGLTAFDLALLNGNETIATSFYKSIFEIDKTHPQQALLRVITISSLPDPDRRIFPGTAIFDPIQAHNVPLIKALICRGIDLTATNQHGDTALHVAVAGIDAVDIATSLLEAGADVNAIGNRGSTPLHYAIDTDMVMALLGHGADISVQDIDGYTALDLAYQNHRADFTLLLESHMMRMMTEGGQDDQSVVLASEMDLEMGLDPLELSDESGQTMVPNALLDAVRNGDLKVVQTLLEQGADTETKDELNRTALHLAVNGGHAAIVEALLNGGADIEAIALVTSSMRRLLSMIRGSQKKGYRVLHLAARRGNTALTKILLARGAKVNSLNCDVEMALRIAARYGHTEVVKILLDNGAETRRSVSKLSALDIATIRGHWETVTVLLAAGQKHLPNTMPLYQLHLLRRRWQ